MIFINTRKMTFWLPCTNMKIKERRNRWRLFLEEEKILTLLTSKTGYGSKIFTFFVFRDHLKTLLENVFTLPRHSGRNSSLTDSIGQYIMRKFGRMGLLSGTQVFQPSQFYDMVMRLNTGWTKTIDYMITLFLVLGGRRPYWRGQQHYWHLSRWEVLHIRGQDSGGGSSLGHHSLHWWLQWQWLRPGCNGGDCQSSDPVPVSAPVHHHICGLW